MDHTYLNVDKACDQLNLVLRVACGQAGLLPNEIFTAIQVARDALEEIRPRQP
jgi:hypothetical protein